MKSKQKSHVIYINIDGFARYYFDEFIKRSKEEPFLQKIINEGVFFNNLRNVLPSITNPCQNMILSGSTSAITKNVYRYYDKKENVVVQQKRENETKLISEVAVNNNLKVVSVAHYLTEKHLTNDDPKKLYIHGDPTNPKVVKRGIEKGRDHFSRFEQLLKVINKEPIKVDDKIITVDEFPDLLICYVDDLDGLGHNFVSTYGSKVAETEEERINNVLTTLKEIDQKISEVVEALKRNNLYDKTTIFITTDHGMTPYGLKSQNDNGNYGLSMIPNLFNKLKEIDNSLEIEFLSPGEKAKPTTNLVVVGANLNVQLTFLNDKTEEELLNIKKLLQDEFYIDKIKTRKQLEEEEKYWTYAADMIISPKDRYFFSKNTKDKLFVRGQHDSMLESANHIVGWVIGNKVKKLGSTNIKAYNYDYGVMMAYLLGIELPKYNGKVLDIFE